MPRLTALERLGRISGSTRMIAGLISSDWELLRRAAANGYRMLSWSSELGMIARSAKEGVAAIRSLANGSEDVSAP